MVSNSSSITADDVIQILAILANEEKLQVTVTESLKGGAIAGIACFVGGLLGGSKGLAIGAAIGGIGAAVFTHGKFESVGSVLQNMSKDDKEKLFEKSCQVFAKFSIKDIIKLQEMITDTDLRQELLGTVVKHVEEQLHMEITH